MGATAHAQSSCVGMTTTISLARNIGCGAGTGSNAFFDGPSGGSIVDPGGSSNTFTVTWSSAGTFRLKRNFPGVCTPSFVYVDYNIGPAVTAPSSGKINQSSTCGQVMLSYSGSGSAYWQTLPTNDDTTYPTSRTVTSSATYYLRIKDGSCWSSATSVAVSVPASPVGGTLYGGNTASGTVNLTLTLAGHTGAVKEYRYIQNGGAEQVVAGTSSTMNVNFTNSTGSTIVRNYWAVVRLNGCDVSSNQTTVVVNAPPGPPVPQIFVCVGDVTSLSIPRSIGCGSDAGSNAQFDVGGGGAISDPGNFASEFTVTWNTPGIYRLKRTFPNGCAATAIYSAYYQVYAKPATPLPAAITESYSCGSTNLTFGGTRGYWQATANGFSFALPTTTKVTATGNYFLKVQSLDGCWSNPMTYTLTTPVLQAPVGGQLSPSRTFNGYVNQTLKLTGYYGNIKEYWYRDDGGTAVKVSGTTDNLKILFANNTSGTVTREYWAVVRANDCEVKSGIATLIIKANPGFENPQVNFAFSGTATVTLTSDKSSDRWFANANGGIALSSNNSVGVSTTPATYYIERIGADGVVIRFPYTIDGSFVDRGKHQLNYVKRYIPQKEFNQLTLSEPPNDVAKSITYFDGLAREDQSIAIGASPLGYDIVTPIVFDANSRNNRQYLPYVTNENNGRYKTLTYTTSGNYTHAFYATTSDNIADDTRPFSETLYEASPLNRPLKKYGAGASWYDNNKPTSYGYLINKHGNVATDQEQVIDWVINAGIPARSNGFYSSGQLTISSVKDEHGNEVRTYTNSRGQMILKKVQAVDAAVLSNKDHWAQTYYVYDDFNRLRFVFPPELTKLIYQSTTYIPTTAELNAWAFQYLYDDRGRMVQKKIPGADWVYMIYDNRDRLVYTQDGNQRLSKQWLFAKYDEFNRPVLTGIKDTTATVDQPTMQTVVNTWYKTRQTRWNELRSTAAGSVHGYTNTSYPSVTDPSKYLTVVYYDDYAWKSGIYNSARLKFRDTELPGEQETAEKSRVRGLVTGSKVKVLDGGNNWLWSITYYDAKDRVIQTISDNIKGGTDCVTNVLDFNGKIKKMKSVHVDQDVTWKDRVNMSLIGTTVAGTASAGWGLMGAASVQSLPAATFGYVEVTVNDLAGNAWAVGLSSSNADANVNTINYGVGINGSTLYTYENSNGTNRGIVAKGDILKVIRSASGAVNFYRNDIWICAASSSSTAAMIVDMAIYSPSSTFSNVVATFGANTHTVNREFDYDHAGRLSKIWHKYNSGPKVLLVSNSYNELGQLVDKKLHSVNNGVTGKQSVDYRYNIRGWLTSINGADLNGGSIINDDNGSQARDLFGMDLLYEKPDALMGTSGFYNGNISAIRWSNNLGLDDATQNSYKYTYDPLNRITSASFAKKNELWSNPSNAYNESNYTYDLNGNIRSLTRNGEAANMDVLTYDYGSTDRSNRLLKVSDAGNKVLGFSDGSNTGNDYTYDANGNMITDLNKEISTNITYNHLNLPVTVSRGSASGSITYVYDATGKKLSQVTKAYAAQKQVDYAGEYEYLEDDLQSIQHEEGRIQVKGRKQLFYNDGTQSMGLNCNGCTLTPVIQNTDQTYLKIVSGGTTVRTGISNIAGAIPVTAGEKYLIRAKGYSVSYDVYILAQVNGIDVSTTTKMPQYTPDAESWLEAVVAIPTTGTLTTGLIWPNVVNGSTFYLNDFEIQKITDTTPEYQYNLKDHLGNVRLTFTTKTDVEIFQAGYETANSASEAATFNPSYSNAAIGGGAVHNHTTGGDRSQRLAATASEIIGLSKSLRVLPGDTINAEVYAKYLSPTTTSTNVAAQIFAAMASSFGVAATSVGDGATLYETLNTLNDAGLLVTMGEGVDENQPKAYLNYILFDKDYLPYDMGFKQVTNSASSAYERLTLQAKPTKPGYAYFYISNENAKVVEVYFDDFRLEHVKSPVIQSQDYYPFGLTFNSYSRENTSPDQNQFNGKENQDELDLEWHDFGTRMYMTDIARWTTIDPLSERTYNWTPYRFGYNNPVRFFDRNGLTEEERQKAVEWAIEFIKNNLNKQYIRDGKNDCSWLVNEAIVAAGMSNMKTGSGLRGAANGVALLAGNMRQTSNLNEARIGDAVTFRSTRNPHIGKDGEFDHVGLVTKIYQDENGNVVGYEVANFQGSGPRLLEYKFTDPEERRKAGKTVHFELNGVYQWDTEEDDKIYDGGTFEPAVIYGKPEKYSSSSSPQKAFEAIGIPGFESWRSDYSKKKLANKIMGEND